MIIIIPVGFYPVNKQGFGTGQITGHSFGFRFYEQHLFGTHDAPVTGIGVINTPVIVVVCEFDVGVVDVEVLKAEGFNQYRIIDPYPVSLVSQDSWYGGPRAEEIAFWVTSGGNVAWDAFWYIGLNYSATEGQPIKAYLPSALAASQAPNDANSKFLTDKIVYFNPYYYIDGLGGYNLQDVYLSLPGGPDLYEYLGL